MLNINSRKKSLNQLPLQWQLQIIAPKLQTSFNATVALRMMVQILVFSLVTAPLTLAFAETTSEIDSADSMSVTLKPAAPKVGEKKSDKKATAAKKVKAAKAAAIVANKNTTDDLTKKALKRAQIHELEREQQVEVSTTNEQVGPIIMKPVVQSGPAPGVKSAATDGTASATSSEKARQLIMTSHVDVGAESESKGETKPEVEAESKQLVNESASAVDANQKQGLSAADSTKVPPAKVEAKSESRATTIPGANGTDSTTVVPEAYDKTGDTAETASTEPTKATVASAQASSPVSAEQSLKWLTNGNTRYTKKRFRSDGRSEKDRARIWDAGQKPHAIVLACSDSVVPPEAVFDQSLGEIFVVRTLGEITDASTLASLEYAVQYLGPHMLVVMGHSRCDAVQGIVQVKESESAGSESLDHLLSEIRVHTKSYTSEKPSPNLEVESTLNADGVARDLVNRSEIIRKQVESGQLVIKSALYRGDSGKVTFY